MLILQNGNNNDEKVTTKGCETLIRPYHRFLAVTLSAVMTVMPATALASGYAEDDLTEAVALAIAQQELTTLQESLLADAPRLPEEADTEPTPPDVFIPEEWEAEPTEEPLPEWAVALTRNGEALQLENHARLVNNVTYVPVRDFFGAMECNVTWDSASGTVRITRGEELEGRLTPDSSIARFNGRCWYMTAPCISVEGMAMMPLRDAAKVFNSQVSWDADTRTVHLSGYGLLQAGGSFYNEQDLLWIARIVRHEAGNQILDGKVAVANVILNRMKSAGFPNTAEEVIFDTRTGVQFVTRESTKIYIDPSEECFVAAKLAMEGYETAPDCLYFASNRVAKRCWAGRNRPWFGTIGGHTFFL